MADFWSRQDKTLYVATLVLRLSFALWGTGYIHPDEYFQNGEAVASPILDVYTSKTWEWDPHFPARSILPVWFSTGVPFMIARFLSQGATPAPTVVFLAERLSFFLSSFFIDYAVYHLVQESVRWRSLVVVGSSYVLHTFHVRPFTNPLEALLIALSLLCLKRLLVAEAVGIPTNKTVALYLPALAFMAICGLFTRVTFAAFFFPIALEVLNWTLRQAQFAPLRWARFVAPSLMVAMLTVASFVYADNMHFAISSSSRPIQLTPVNLLRYNFKLSNLDQHGIHPRWLHIGVNVPMLVTPGLLFYALWAQFDYFKTTRKEASSGRRGVVETMQRAFLCVQWSGSVLLSVLPHQEPRYVLPVVVPIIASVMNNGRILRAGRWFWLTWTVANVALAVLFGVLHQGGVVPSLFRVHDIIYDSTSGTSSHDFLVVYWKTYMPPRHILAVKNEDIESHAVTVLDYNGGGSAGDVVRALQAPAGPERPLTVLLVAPFYAVRQLGAAERECVAERDRVFPHLSLDDLGDSLEVGWGDRLSLGIFDVDQACLIGAPALAVQSAGYR